MTDDVAAVLERARELVDPEPDERAALERAADELKRRAERAIDDLPVEAEVLRVGSTARGTWLSGARDVDLFVRFPTTLDRDSLRKYGLDVGQTVLENGREQYAEHPYTVGEYEGFDVDIVPCYAVDSAAEIRSAVDRTPFHNEYVSERLDDDLAAEVRLAKGFCRGIGIYGSNLRTRGFGGYLLELLILEHGGFTALLEAASDWPRPVAYDPENHGQVSFDDPMVMIDPTDPERNVAAVLSATNLARFQHHARAFLAAPDVSTFELNDPDPIDAGTLRAQLDRRDTTPVAVRFSAPDIVDDDLYPQLRTSLRGITNELDRRDFDVLRSTIAVDEGNSGQPEDRGDALLLVELEVADLPSVVRHEGPPVYVAAHAAGFYDKYVDDPDVYGPFVDGDRYVVERERSVTTAVEWFDDETLFEVKHGVDVVAALHDGYDVLVDEELTALLPTFGKALRSYFEPRP